MPYIDNSLSNIQKGMPYIDNGLSNIQKGMSYIDNGYGAYLDRKAIDNFTNNQFYTYNPSIISLYLSAITFLFKLSLGVNSPDSMPHSLGNSANLFTLST